MDCSNSYFEDLCIIYNGIQQRFWNLISTLWDFFSSVWNVLSYIWEIIKALRFWMGSLLSWLWDLIVEIMQWEIFTNLGITFNYISEYIGGPATVFLSTILLIALFRIFISFVFKLFKGSDRYNALQHNLERNAKMREFSSKVGPTLFE